MKSLADLEGILRFISRDKPLAAHRFVDDLQQRCELLRRFPQMGGGREDLAAHLRLLTHRGYGIYYRNLPNQVRIERVLHPAIDVAGQTFE